MIPTLTGNPAPVRRLHLHGTLNRAQPTPVRLLPGNRTGNNLYTFLLNLSGFLYRRKETGERNLSRDGRPGGLTDDDDHPLVALVFLVLLVPFLTTVGKDQRRTGQADQREHNHSKKLVFQALIKMIPDDVLESFVFLIYILF